MQIKLIGPNQTEVTSNGNTVFFSYTTPVAAIVGGIAYRTSEKFSKTTSRHINKWLGGRTAIEQPQSFFEALR